MKLNEKEIRAAVREHYGDIADRGGSCCSSAGKSNSCCARDGEVDSAGSLSEVIGYSREELDSIPEGSEMGLGCGNPLAFGSLKAGDTVLDLGSGGGIDCFLAANIVGESGRVIGVDMTPPMLEKAREIAEINGYSNVEFRLGEIENLPVSDAKIDLIISNCVINLSVNKKRVFEEAFRTLKPGGKLMISDIVLLEELPEAVRLSLESYSACIAGALQKEKYLDIILDAGFEEVRVESESIFSLDLALSDPTVTAAKETLNISDIEAGEIARTILSVSVSARKPVLT